MIELSDSSLDANIPSYPQSRSSEIDEYQFSPLTLLAYDNDDQDFENIVFFLHEDKEFLIAAEIGHVKLLQNLISKDIDVQQLDSLGRNALHLAVCNGNERAIRLLLNTKVDPNVKDNVGCTPLSLSLIRSPSLKITKLLLQHGAIITKRYSPTDTGLFLNFIMMSEPSDEEMDIMRLLVQDYGALLEDPEAPGGRQALHYAAMSNNCKLITILVDLGADLFVTNHRKQSPKDVAIAFNCKEAEFYLQSLEYNNLVSNRKSIIKSKHSKMKVLKNRP